MEPIERDIAERKALLAQWAREIATLIRSKAFGVSIRQSSEIDHQITTLRHKIDLGEFALKELEEIAAEGRLPRMQRPPLPQARRLSVVERQRLEQEHRAKLKAALSPSADTEIHVYVGRLTDERGNPQIEVHVGPRRRVDDA